VAPSERAVLASMLGLLERGRRHRRERPPHSLRYLASNISDRSIRSVIDGEVLES
jgi:hypothetical protein